MKKTLLAATTAAIAIAAGSAAYAQSAGDITLSFGVGYVNPMGQDGVLAGGTIPIDVNDDLRPTVALEYFIRDNLGIEVLAATPFSHDIAIAGGPVIGKTKHLPPTVSLNYHFNTGGNITPFVGAGLNYTIFFDEGSPLGALKIDDSVGLALHAGADFKISDKGAIRVDLRYIQIEPKVYLGGAYLGRAEINPAVVGVSYVMSF